MSRLIAASLAASLLTLGLAGAATAGGDLPPEDYPPAAVPSCDIRVSHEGGSVVLESLVFSPVPVTGVYELDVRQGGYAGSSNIRQSSDFEAAPGAGNSLGVVALASSGGYAARLVVHWDDGAADCTREIRTRGRSL